MTDSYTNPLVTLHEITLGLLSEENPENLFHAMLDTAIELTGADSGSIALLDDDRKYLKIHAFRGMDVDTPEKVQLKIGEGVTGRCILIGKTRNVGDTKDDPYYVEVRSDIRSELAVPLKIGNKAFGVISVDSSKVNNFNSDHEEYIELLANYASIIFTNKNALEHLRHRSSIQDLLLELSSYLGKSDDIHKIYEDMFRVLEKNIRLGRGAIYLYDDVRDELFVVAGENYTDEQILLAVYKPGEGITGKAYSDKKIIAIQDTSKEKRFLNKTGAERNSVSFFAAPIILAEKVYGVLTLEFAFENVSKFEDYQFLVQILSSFLAQAIQIHLLVEKSREEIRSENLALKRELNKTYSYHNIIGKSKPMISLFEKMQMAADSSASVLLVGSSGTGKELIASSLHYNSIRNQKNLVKINVAAIPNDLLESELFGYVKGAFTGADEEKKGKFLIAHEGTLVLDEIGEMHPSLQAKLLRILQEKEFSPLGSNHVYKVDVRIIASTNANLEDKVRKGEFREDLYYRLNVIRLEVPSLRDRKEDLPLLVQFFLDKTLKNNNRKTVTLSASAIQKLMDYDYPGNVRELENIIERSVILSSLPVLDAEDIQIQAFSHTQIPEEKALPKQNMGISGEKANWINYSSLMAEHPGEDILKFAVEKVEKEIIAHFLKKNLFNKSKTSRLLGINRLTLDKKIKEYGILEELMDDRNGFH